MTIRDDNNGRTHDPSLRELTADLDGLRALIEAQLSAIHELLEERDKRYTERSEDQKSAITSALAAAKEQTRAAFEASERAITKSEEAQSQYNVRSNEFRDQLRDQATLLMTRTESLAMHRSADDKFVAFVVTHEKIHEGLLKEIAGLRESRSASGGVFQGIHAGWIVLMGAVALVAGVLSITTFLAKQPVANAVTAPVPQIIYVPANPTGSGGK
jgi:hypothetical protein